MAFLQKPTSGDNMSNIDSQPCPILLIGVCWSCLLSAAYQFSIGFKWMRFYLRLTFAIFCSNLQVIDVFRYFVSCSVISAFCKCYRKVIKTYLN